MPTFLHYKTSSTTAFIPCWVVPSGKDVLLVASSCTDCLTHHAHDMTPVSCSPDLHVPTAGTGTSAGIGATPEYQHSELVLLRFVGLYLFMYNTAFYSAQNLQHPFKQCYKQYTYLTTSFLLQCFRFVSNDHFQFSFLL